MLTGGKIRKLNHFFKILSILHIYLYRLLKEPVGIWNVKFMSLSCLICYGYIDQCRVSEWVVFEFYT